VPIYCASLQLVPFVDKGIPENNSEIFMQDDIDLRTDFIDY